MIADERAQIADGHAMISLATGGEPVRCWRDGAHHRHQLSTGGRRPVVEIKNKTKQKRNNRWPSKARERYADRGAFLNDRLSTIGRHADGSNVSRTHLPRPHLDRFGVYLFFVRHRGILLPVFFPRNAGNNKFGPGASVGSQRISILQSPLSTTFEWLNGPSFGNWKPREISFISSALFPPKMRSFPSVSRPQQQPVGNATRGLEACERRRGTSFFRFFLFCFFAGKTPARGWAVRYPCFHPHRYQCSQANQRDNKKKVP